MACTTRGIVRERKPPSSASSVHARRGTTRTPSDCTRELNDSYARTANDTLEEARATDEPLGLVVVVECCKVVEEPLDITQFFIRCFCFIFTKKGVI